MASFDFSEPSVLVRTCENERDAFIKCVTFLEGLDIVNLLCVCKVVRAAFQDEFLWSALIQSVDGSWGGNSVALLMHAFQFPSYEALYKSFFRLREQVSTCMYFRSLSSDMRVYDGGFYRVVLSGSTNTALVQAVDFRGHLVNSWSASYRLQQKAIIASDRVSEFSVLPICDGFRLHHHPTLRTLVVLPPSVEASVPHHWAERLGHAVGVFSSVYGSHGVEILHTSLRIIDGRTHLCGLKITGDRNVPAGQLSFKFDLESDHPVQEMSNPTIFVNPFAVTEEVLGFFNGRQDHIEFRVQGELQINRHPPEWNPEWEPATYILYHSTNTHTAFPTLSNIVFSVVWDRSLYGLHHCMDFMRVPTDVEML